MTSITHNQYRLLLQLKPKKCLMSWIEGAVVIAIDIDLVEYFCSYQSAKAFLLELLKKESKEDAKQQWWHEEDGS